MRYVTALLVSEFEISLAPGEDGRRSVMEMKDRFTARPGKLKLVFQPQHGATHTWDCHNSHTSSTHLVLIFRDSHIS